MSQLAKPRTVAYARPTVAAAMRQWATALARAGIEDAGTDVRRLVVAVLDVPAARLLGSPDRVLSASELATLSDHVARRARREPVSRILGQRDFYGRSFLLSPATLDPRPDSETLIEAALGLVGEEGWDPSGLRLLDVGTGTGCLLLTLLSELPLARGIGTDIDEAALDVARANAARLGVADRASWLTADALESVGGIFHILVSNPPYVRTGDIAGLEPEVREYDPATALDGGVDGFELYRRLARRIAAVVPHGWAILEVGYDQADAVVAIIRHGVAPAEALVDVRIISDVAGKRRCVAVKTRSSGRA
jgi:release factor glutamine methyltransferase